MIEPIDIIRIVAGLALASFVPGYLLTRILFKELSELEKIALGFVLSIAIDIFLGLFLGYNESMKNFTGGITAMNLWIYLGSLTLILIIIYRYTNKEEHNKLIKWVKQYFERGKQHPK